MVKSVSKIPSVLAFEKKLVLSDGYMYGTTWKDDKTTWEEHCNAVKPKPLALTEKSVRGTISNRLEQTVLNDPVKLNAKVESPNLQKVDACALALDQDTLKVSFTIKVLGGVEKPSACNNETFNKAYTEVAKKYIKTEGFKELARRYAINIANGRYLWRNRVGAEKVDVVVSVNEKRWVFDALKFPLRNFEPDHKDVLELADLIADTLCKEDSYLLITVDAYSLIGKAQEVYPSEELVLNKKKDKKENDKSKVLYALNEIAAIHSQKIGNAIRTIDTWYPEFGIAEIGPIAIDPYGAVTNLGRAYRAKEGTDFYTLFDNYALGGKLANKEQEHYVMAVLVRGGVFGQSSKE